MSVALFLLAHHFFVIGIVAIVLGLAIAFVIDHRNLEHQRSRGLGATVSRQGVPLDDPGELAASRYDSAVEAVRHDSGVCVSPIHGSTVERASETAEIISSQFFRRRASA
jgi:hypothetical protein